MTTVLAAAVLLANLLPGPGDNGSSFCAEAAHSGKVGLKVAADSSPAKYHLGMAGYTYKAYKTDAMLAEMEKLGIRYLCVKAFHLPLAATDAEIADFKAKCAAHGVIPYALGPIDMSTEEEAEKAFAFAQRFGAKLIVGVPFKTGKTEAWKDRVANLELCRKVSALCDRYDIRFEIHNHGPDMPLCFPTAESVVAAVKDLSPRMGMCLDIAHEYRSFRDPVAAIRTYGDLIFDFHLKNLTTDATRLPDNAVPLGRGVLDLKAILSALREVGYAGSCSIEYEADFDNNHAPLAACVDYWKNM